MTCGVIWRWLRSLPRRVSSSIGGRDRQRTDPAPDYWSGDRTVVVERDGEPHPLVHATSRNGGEP